MKKKAKEPPLPSERQETIRQDIMHLLKERSLSAREISSEVKIREKEVSSHLEHIQRTAHAKGLHLRIVPSVCLHCGFIFAKRERLRKPGRCPVCRGESIREPLFSMKD